MLKICIFRLVCEDTHEDCADWASVGYCDSMEEVLENCKLSCNVCDPGNYIF